MPAGWSNWLRVIKVICCSSEAEEVYDATFRGFLAKKEKKEPQNCLSLGLFYKITSRLVISPEIKLGNFDVAKNLIKTDQFIFLFSC